MAAIKVFDVGDRRGRANSPRTALISAAVTGNSVVRNWQPPEGEATQEVA